MSSPQGRFADGARAIVKPVDVLSNDPVNQPGPLKSRDGSATGNDFSMTAWMSVKIAVVPPMPSASVSIAVTVNTGASRNWRSA